MAYRNIFIANHSSLKLCNNQLIVNNGEEFYTPHKVELQLLLNSAVVIDGKRHSVANAIDLMVQSVISSFESNDIQLKLPELIETSYFNYD